MKFLQDDKGNFSSTRLIILLASIWAMFQTSYIMIAAFKIANGDNVVSIITAGGGFFLTVIGALATFKVQSKKAEI